MRIWAGAWPVPAARHTVPPSGRLGVSQNPWHRKRAAPFGVNVGALEPGGMRTNWGARTTKDTPDLLPDYEPSGDAVARARSLGMDFFVGRQGDREISERGCDDISTRRPGTGKSPEDGNSRKVRPS